MTAAFTNLCIIIRHLGKTGNSISFYYGEKHHPSPRWCCTAAKLSHNFIEPNFIPWQTFGIPKHYYRLPVDVTLKWKICTFKADKSSFFLPVCKMLFPTIFYIAPNKASCGPMNDDFLPKVLNCSARVKTLLYHVIKPICTKSTCSFGDLLSNQI